MGRHSNLIFVDGEGRILDMRAPGERRAMSSVREVLPGLRYERPPAHGKTPFDAPEAAHRPRPAAGRAALLSQGSSPAAISGLSAADGARSWPSAPPATRTRTRRNWTCHPDSARAVARRNVPNVCRTSAAPALLFAEDRRAGGRGGLSVFEPRAPCAASALPPSPRRMDAFYRARDRAERIHAEVRGACTAC